MESGCPARSCGPDGRRYHAMRIRGFLEKVTYWAGVIWAQIGLLILSLLILDAVAGAVIRNIYRFQDRPHSLPADAYAQAPWVSEYFKALNHTTTRWYPYVYWKSSPQSSPYLT